MNALNIYIQFISDRLKKEPLIYKNKNFNARRKVGSWINNEYWEVHHILLKSIKENNESNNLINLTYEDHIAAHLLLYHIFKNTSKQNQVIYPLSKMLAIGKTGRKSSYIVNKKIKQSLALLRKAHLEVSEETKQKISIANKGRKLSLATRAKLSKARKGWVETKEHKKHISEGVRGKNCYWYGRKSANAQGAECVEDLTTRIKYATLTEAAKESGTTRQNIQNCLLTPPKQKTAAGHKWAYCSGHKTRPYKFKSTLPSSAKPVVCEEENILYIRIIEAAKAINKGYQGIVAVVNGRQKTAYGYHWRYATEIEIMNLKKILKETPKLTSIKLKNKS